MLSADMIDMVDIVVMGPMIIQVIRGIFFLMLSADMIDMGDIVVLLVDWLIHTLLNQLLLIDSQ